MLIDPVLLLAGSCIAACGLSLGSTPLARAIALRTGVVDHPGGRKTHGAATPLLGGLAIFGSTVLPTVLYLLLSDRGSLDARWFGAGIGSILVLLVGIGDDVLGLRARYKFVLQVIIAGILVAFGLQIDEIRFPTGNVPLGIASIPLTVLWIVAIVNAWNLIDGLDGLAAGTAVLAAGFLAVGILPSGEVAAPILLVSLAGACAGFLRHNLHPASIFMGDGGSLFLGYVFAVVPLLVREPGTQGTVLAGGIPLLIYLVPVGDTVAAIWRRSLLAGRIWTSWRLPARRLFPLIGAPDRGHLHHAILRRGLRHRRAVAVVWGLGLLSGGLSLLGRSSPAGWVPLILAPPGMMAILWRLGCTSSSGLRREGPQPVVRGATSPLPLTDRAVQRTRRRAV